MRSARSALRLASADHLHNKEVWIHEKYSCKAFGVAQHTRMLDMLDVFKKSIRKDWKEIGLENLVGDLIFPARSKR